MVPTGFPKRRPVLLRLVLALILAAPIVAPPQAWPASAAAPAADGVASLAVVRDGETSRFLFILDAITHYLRELAGSDYKLRMIDRHTGDFSPEGVRKALLAAMHDPEVEVIYAAGPLVTEVAAKLSASERSKPVFGGFPELSDREDSNIGANGRSRVPNFTFAATPGRAVTDIRMLKRLTNAEKIHVLVDAGLLSMRLDWDSRIREVREDANAWITMHGVHDDPEAAVAALPADTTAVYVSVLPRLSEEGITRLYDLLAERKIFSLAMNGRRGLDEGAAAGLSAQIFDPLLRRTALNLNRIFLGESTSDLTVYLPIRDQLVFNKAVVDRIGWEPDYETLLAAQFLGPDSTISGAPVLTLDDAMEIAAERNATARSQIHAAATSRADARVARGALLPIIEVGASQGKSHFWDRSAPTTPDNAHSGDYGLTLRQILFNDEVWSGARAQQRLAEAATFDARSAVLDARAAAATAFLQYIQQSELLLIDRENLSLSEGNRRLAGLRVDIGSADPTEIYRWESEVARARANLLQREAARNNARIELNRVLGAPRTKQWNIAPLTLEDDQFFFMDDALAGPLQQRDQIDKVASYFQNLAVENSPELASFDQALTAQGILIGQRKRAFFVPSIALETGLNRSIDGGDGIDTNSQNEWQLGVSLSYPLFDGLRRGARVDRENAELRRLEALRDDAIQRIEQSALSAFNALQANHADIRLSRQATFAAQKNFEAVSEKYSQGAATVLDSLDAQSGLLSQRQRATTALYDYLIDTINLQRSIAWFESSAAPGERDAWKADFEAALGSEAQ